jgi:hypothetical protein
MARPSTRLQFLKGELVIAAKEVRQESEEVKQHGNHRIEIFFGSEPTDHALGYRRDSWRATSGRVPSPWEEVMYRADRPVTDIPCESARDVR